MINAAIPTRMPKLIQISGVAKESCVRLYKAIANHENIPAIPRYLPTLVLDPNVINASPSTENKNAIKTKKPIKPVSASRRTYRFLGFGYRRLSGLSWRAISGTVVNAQSGKWL